MLAAKRRAVCLTQVRRRPPALSGASGASAPAGDDDGAAYLVDVAWRGIAVWTRRCGTPQAADVAGGSFGSAGADLSARSGFSDRSPAVRPKGAGGPKAGRAAGRSLGQPKINSSAPLGSRLTKIRDGL